MSISGDGLNQTSIVAKLDYLQNQFSQIVAKLFVDGLQTCSQFPCKNNTTLKLNASPPRIFEHVDILGAAVPGEGQQRCVRRDDVGCFAITESLGDAIVVEATDNRDIPAGRRGREKGPKRPSRNEKRRASISRRPALTFWRFFRRKN